MPAETSCFLTAKTQTVFGPQESDHAPGREVQAGDVGDMADSFLQSWATWEWKNFYRGNDSLVRQVGLTMLQLN